MPPKRGRGGARGGARGASRARGTPGPSTVDDTREATPVVDPTMRSRRTPAPSRFSSSYGSPVVLNSSRNLSGGSARSAIGAALETIKTANEEDLQQSDSDATGRSDDHDDNSARGSDDDTRAMPPPPLPIQRGLRGRRAGSVQPVSLFDGGSSPQTRFGSEPPYSDAMSQRSFVEESQIYSGADFATPRRPRATGPDRSRQSPATRSSARLAAKNSAARSDASVTPSPPRPGANTHARVPPPMSDSIDENDEEDPLLNPTPRGLPARKGSVDAASPDLSDRMRRARAARGPRLLSESDRGDSSEDSDVGESSDAERPRKPSTQPHLDSRGPQPSRPNPVQDARTGDLRLPHPRSHNILNNVYLPTPPMNGGLHQPLGLSNGLATSNVSSSWKVNKNTAVPAARQPAAGDIRADSASSFYGGPALYEEEDIEDNLCLYIVKEFLNLFRFSKWPRWLGTAMQAWGLLVLLCWGFLIILGISLPAHTWEGVSVSKDQPLHGISHWRQNVAQWVPWVVLHPFAVLTGDLHYVDFRDQLHWAEIGNHRNAIQIDTLTGAVDEMRRILPELIAIKVDKSSNKWTVDDAFWHAMNEEVKQGGLMHSILTMEKSRNDSYTISDSHWGAILQRIQAENLLLPKQPVVTDGELALDGDITDYVDQAVSQAWADWLKNNEEAIKRSRGDAEEDRNPHWQDLYGDVDKIVAQRLQALGLEERIVTKENFIQEVERQSSQHAAQIRVEMEAMQGRLDTALAMAEEAKAAAEVPAGMSQTEVKAMIDQVVRRSIADAQLESVAKGHIKASLDNGLLRRRNYFSTLRGAIVDPSLTSSSYDWGSKATEVKGAGGFLGLNLFSRRKWEPTLRDGGQDAGVSFSPSMALEKWEEDGQCWCAGVGDAKDISGAADLSILTADTVIPQHLVVEHITAEATFDPGSMPKDIEVWIRAPTDKRSRTLQDWSSQRWGSALRGPDSNRLRQRGFVKVAEFQYDNSVTKGESQIFRLPEELLNMDAQTRQVLVRAKTNYGAKDHTCFYRLQLWGDEGGNRDMSMVE